MDTIRREDHDHTLCKHSRYETPNEGPAPDVYWRVGRGPTTGVVAQTNLERKIDEDGQRQIFIAEAFIKQLEIRDGVIGLEPNFGNEMNDDDTLNVAELEYAKHGSVNLEDAIAVFGLVFLLQQCQSQCHENICPAPEAEISAKSYHPFRKWSLAKPAISEFGGLEGEENCVREEVAPRQANGLGGRGIGEIRW